MKRPTLEQVQEALVKAYGPAQLDEGERVAPPPREEAPGVRAGSPPRWVRAGEPGHQYLVEVKDEERG